MHIALVEDDLDLNTYFSMVLETADYQVSSFEKGEQFLASLREGDPSYDLVLSDYILPGALDGFQLYTSAKREGLSAPFLLMTAFGDFDLAVQALKAGVADYLIKPLKEDLLLKKVASYNTQRSLEEEVLFNRLGKRVVAESAKMQEILKKLSRFAKSRASILLTGESGTGKEVLSRMLHDISPRGEGRFAAVNTSAIPDALFESEFFGYKKGAFTDASRDHEGFARMAHGGTLFLDEVGELSVTSQAKLLRLLEERQVQPLGSEEVYPVDFKLISATNRDLQELVSQGHFREDLYYRLAVISVQIPPLRERPDDIIPLARHLLHQLANDEGLEAIDFTPEAQAKLLSYSWSGNVRELKNRVYEALLATDKSWIEAHHVNLPGEKPNSSQPLSYEKAKAGFEKSYAVRLLKLTRGNVNRLSELSGLSRKAVYDLMKRHALSPAPYRK